VLEKLIVLERRARRATQLAGGAALLAPVDQRESPEPAPPA